VLGDLIGSAHSQVLLQQLGAAFGALTRIGI